MNMVLGADIVNISRIEKAIGRHGAFLERVFCKGEIEYAYSRKFPGRHLAGRFAVKEAVMKALGTGWGKGIRWKDIELVKNVEGAPIIHLYGKTEVYAKKRNLHSVQVSISYAGDLAMACVVFFT